jgi:hypothetical protein
MNGTEEDTDSLFQDNKLPVIPEDQKVQGTQVQSLPSGVVVLLEDQTDGVQEDLHNETGQGEELSPHVTEFVLNDRKDKEPQVITGQSIPRGIEMEQREEVRLDDHMDREHRVTTDPILGTTISSHDVSKDFTDLLPEAEPSQITEHRGEQALLHEPKESTPETEAPEAEEPNQLTDNIGDVPPLLHEDVDKTAPKVEEPNQITDNRGDLPLPLSHEAVEKTAPEVEEPIHIMGNRGNLPLLHEAKEKTAPEGDEPIQITDNRVDLAPLLHEVEESVPEVEEHEKIMENLENREEVATDPTELLQHTYYKVLETTQDLVLVPTQDEDIKDILIPLQQVKHSENRGYLPTHMSPQDTFDEEEFFHDNDEIRSFHSIEDSDSDTEEEPTVVMKASVILNYKGTGINDRETKGDESEDVPASTSQSTVIDLKRVEHRISKTNLLLMAMNSAFQQVYDSINTETTLLVTYSTTDTYENIREKLEGYIFENVGLFTHAGTTGLSFLEREAPVRYDASNRTFVNFLQKIPMTPGSSYLDLFGCSVGLQSQFLKKLQEDVTSNFIVRASTNSTGNTQSGGDWVLEYGGIRVDRVYFNDTIREWDGTLELSHELPPALITTTTENVSPLDKEVHRSHGKRRQKTVPSFIFIILLATILIIIVSLIIVYVKLSTSQQTDQKKPKRL